MCCRWIREGYDSLCFFGLSEVSVGVHRWHWRYGLASLSAGVPEALTTPALSRYCQPRREDFSPTDPKELQSSPSEGHCY